MLNTLKLIYEKLCRSYQASNTDVLTTDVLRLLKDKSKAEPEQVLYKDLIVQISELKSPTVTLLFIERYCLSKLSDKILEQYAVNVAEAFTLSFILLNKPVELSNLYFKLGNSGLLGPTLINGQKISDVEAVAEFVISSLEKVKFITVYEKWATVGPAFKLEV